MSEEMDRIEARAHEQLRVLRRASTDLDEVRVAVSSPDGSIRVELDGVCALVGLTLTAAACRSDGAVLGRRIVDIPANTRKKRQEMKKDSQNKHNLVFIH